MAQTRFGEDGWRETVECVRQFLVAIAGLKAEDEDNESEIADPSSEAYKQTRTSKLGYVPSRDLARPAAKFMADLILMT